MGDVSELGCSVAFLQESEQKDLRGINAVPRAASRVVCSTQLASSQPCFGLDALCSDIQAGSYITMAPMCLHGQQRKK